MLISASYVKILYVYIDLRNVLRALLNVDAPFRPFIAEVQTWKWVTAYPSTRPTWRENDAKYTVEKYLPSFLHTIETECLSQPNTLPQVNDSQNQTKEVMSLYPVCKDQQDFKVAESASYDADLIMKWSQLALVCLTLKNRQWVLVTKYPLEEKSLLN